jgi:hypothetical protein
VPDARAVHHEHVVEYVHLHEHVHLDDDHTSTSSSTSTSTSTSTTTTTGTTTSTTLLESPTGLWLPSAVVPANPTAYTWSTAVRCFDFVLPMGIASATKMNWGESGSFSITCDVGIYDAAGTTKLASAGGVTCTNSTNPTTVTGLSSFSLVAGTTYRLCWCGSGSSGSYRALAAATGARVDSAEISSAFTVRQGTASESCSSGVLPSTATSLTPDYTFGPIAVYVSKE